MSRRSAKDEIQEYLQGLSEELPQSSVKQVVVEDPNGSVRSWGIPCDVSKPDGKHEILSCKQEAEAQADGQVLVLGVNGEFCPFCSETLLPAEEWQCGCNPARQQEVNEKIESFFLF